MCWRLAFVVTLLLGLFAAPRGAQAQEPRCYILAADYQWGELYYSDEWPTWWDARYLGDPMGEAPVPIYLYGDFYQSTIENQSSDLLVWAVRQTDGDMYFSESFWPGDVVTVDRSSTWLLVYARIPGAGQFEFCPVPGSVPAEPGSESAALAALATEVALARTDTQQALEYTQGTLTWAVLLLVVLVVGAIMGAIGGR